MTDSFSKAQFQIIKRLGSGAHGSVFSATHKQSNTTYALKKIFCGNDDALTKGKQEVEVMRKFSDRNLVQCYGHFIEDGEAPGCYDLWIVLELCTGGNLSEMVEAGAMHEEKAMKIMAQLLRVTFLLHTHADHIIHRDIKPENVLFTQDGTPKLTDFGSSKQHHNKDAYATVAGTMFFMAPEIQTMRYDNR